MSVCDNRIQGLIVPVKVEMAFSPCHPEPVILSLSKEDTVKCEMVFPPCHPELVILSPSKEDRVKGAVGFSPLSS
jgi:hypothetical protein